MYFKSMQSKYNKQIEVYSELNQVLLDSIPVIKQFNTKQINVKLEEALKKTLISEKVKLYIKVYHSKRTLVISTYNVLYPEYNYDGTKSNFCGRIDKDTVKIYLSPEGFKVDAEFAIRNINNIITRNNAYIEDIKYELGVYDIMKNDYQAICDQIEQFKTKYSYSFREDAGCNFRFII